jgi:hypothetical protein
MDDKRFSVTGKYLGVNKSRGSGHLMSVLFESKGT